jgi:hypothetical protein
LAENRDKHQKQFNKSQLLTAKQPKSGKIQPKSVSIITAVCDQTWNKNPTPNPLPASDEGAKVYLI